MPCQFVDRNDDDHLKVSSVEYNLYLLSYFTRSIYMSCLKESVANAMKTLPTIYTYTSSDGAEHSEDPNLKDVNHLAETIQRTCNLNIHDLTSDKGLSKEQVVEVVELVEKELLSHPAARPVVRDILISHPLAMRVKDESQLIEELNKVAQEVLRIYPQLGNTIEEAIMKSLFMWHGCLNIDKECSLKDLHDVEPALERKKDLCLILLPAHRLVE